MNASKPLLVAIDGPGGVGKSTVARLVAERLELPTLDTGKLYRALGYLLEEKGVDVRNERAVGQTLSTIELELVDGSPHAEGEDLTPHLLTEEAGRLASIVSQYRAVREYLVMIQQAWGRRNGGVLEGRDIGLRVFPETPYKFYLDADEEVRIRRRADQTGESFEEVSRRLRERDRRDRERKIDPLTILPDQIVIDTTNLTVEEVVERIVKRVREGENNGHG